MLEVLVLLNQFAITRPLEHLLTRPQEVEGMDLATVINGKVQVIIVHGVTSEELQPLTHQVV